MALVDNKKAKFNFDIVESFEAGIELTGLEVKSIRKNTVSLTGSFVSIRGGEAFLMQTEIPPYQMNNTPKEYDSRRPRRLLLTKKELRRLAHVEQEKGLTIVPIKMYNKVRKIKVELAIVRGKKKFDKRETIKKRETDRNIERIMKRGE